MAAPVPNQIVIEGDLVRTFKTELVDEARLQDFMPFIEHRPPIMLGMLPKSAPFIYWDESNAKNKRCQIVAELAPGVRASMQGNHRFLLSYPWTYFLFDFTTAGDVLEGANWMHTNTRVYWAREQVIDFNSILYTALVWNCDKAGNICWGSTGITAALPLGTRVERTVDEFYRTTFTHSNGAGSPWQSETGRDDWNRWQEETKKDPAAFLNFPEWDQKKGGNLMTQRKLKDILGSVGDRSRPIEVQSKIPEMITPMTFGRAEEWVREKLSAQEVTQLETAIANYRADGK